MLRYHQLAPQDVDPDGPHVRAVDTSGAHYWSLTTGLTLVG
ncbi:hypothetical protein ACFQ51_54450 [Streptomyces kaempferi]